MIRSSWIRWLHAPPITGWPALVCAFAAAGIPTAVRAAVSGVVTGCDATHYCPAGSVTREQMAVFLSLTFGLTLYGN